MPKTMSNVFVQLVDLVLCQAEVLTQTRAELKNHSTWYWCALDWKGKDTVSLTGKANKQGYWADGHHWGMPSSCSVVQMSPCPQVGVVLVPWVCLWSRESEGLQGCQAEQGAGCPYISNLPGDSNTGLVGEKVRLGITRTCPLAKEMKKFRDYSLNLQQEECAGSFHCWSLHASAPALSLALPLSAPSLHSGNC